MPQINRFECRECGTERTYADGGARALIPCQNCENVTTHKNVGRVYA